MALRYFHKRCEVHGLYIVRRPVYAMLNASIRAEEVIAAAPARTVTRAFE
jgi:hypothetical protein